MGIEQRHPHGRIGLAMPPDVLPLSTPLRLITTFTRLTPELSGIRVLRPPSVSITSLAFGTRCALFVKGCCSLGVRTSLLGLVPRTTGSAAQMPREARSRAAGPVTSAGQARTVLRGAVVQPLAIVLSIAAGTKSCCGGGRGAPVRCGSSQKPLLQ